MSFQPPRDSCGRSSRKAISASVPFLPFWSSLSSSPQRTLRPRLGRPPSEDVNHRFVVSHLLVAPFRRDAREDAVLTLDPFDSYTAGSKPMLGSWVAHDIGSLHVTRFPDTMRQCGRYSPGCPMNPPLAPSAFTQRALDLKEQLTDFEPPFSSPENALATFVMQFVLS